MGADTQGRKFEAAVAAEMAGLVSYAESATVSRILTKNSAGSVTLFAFDAGQNISEHSTPYDALVQVIEGQAELTIGGKQVTAKAGEVVLMPANVPHALDAPQRFKMLLTMLKGA